MCIVAAGSVSQNGRIKQLPATGAFPGIKGADKIIEFLSEHSALAAWTLHGNTPDDVIVFMPSIPVDITSCVPKQGSCRRSTPANLQYLNN
jgi:hypothetical protein